MIKLELVEPDSEDWKEWRKECQLEREAVIERVRNGEDAQLSDLYKDPRMEAIYKHDGSPFFGKCAYCESRIGGTQPGDIEHYRPRRKVAYEDLSPVTVDSNGGDEVPHPGYYWLAYEWSNLLYACIDCNRINKKKHGGVLVGKWSRFPVDGEHATEPGGEVNERPRLLNPLVDEPDEHLSIDETGIIREESERGEVSSRILGLNIRQSLITDRLKAIEDTENAVLAYVTCLAAKSVDASTKLQSLVAARSGALSFALARRFALKKELSRLSPLFDLSQGGG